MTEQRRERITLEFHTGEPIHGTLFDQAGAMHEFRGWLELCAALDRAWQLTSAVAWDPQEEGLT